MSPDAFATLGRSFHGSKWKTALARELGVDRQTVTRYASGSYNIPRRVELAMEALSARKVASLARAERTTASATVAPPLPSFTVEIGP